MTPPAATCRVALEVERTAQVLDLEERVLRERGRVSLLYRALLNSEPVANGWEKLLTAVRKHTLLAPLQREMMILRVCHLLACPMEVRTHEAIARAEGLDEARLAALKQPELDPARFAEDELLLLQLADHLTHAADVEHLIARLRALYGSRVVVEAVVTVAAYNMVARTVEALGID